MLGCWHILHMYMGYVSEQPPGGVLLGGPVSDIIDAMDNLVAVNW